MGKVIAGASPRCTNDDSTIFSCSWTDGANSPGTTKAPMPLTAALQVKKRANNLCRRPSRGREMILHGMPGRAEHCNMPASAPPRRHSASQPSEISISFQLSAVATKTSGLLFPTCQDTGGRIHSTARTSHRETECIHDRWRNSKAGLALGCMRSGYYVALNLRNLSQCDCRI